MYIHVGVCVCVCGLRRYAYTTTDFIITTQYPHMNKRMYKNTSLTSSCLYLLEAPSCFHCATSRKVAGPIPDCVIIIFL